MATSVFFCSQCGELKGVEKESCGRGEKIWNSVTADAKFRTKQFGWAGYRENTSREVLRGIPGSRGRLDECGKKRLFLVFQTFPWLFSDSSLSQHAVYFVSNGGCWPHLSESPRFKQFFSRFCRFYDPSVTKEGDPQHVPKALKVNQEPPEYRACRNGS
jgi:hypothetical protein